MKRDLRDYLIKIWCIASISLVLLIIGFILIYIFIKGISVVTIPFIIDTPRGIPLGTEGGIFPAIVGSLYLMVIACSFAALLAISTAVYLVFYCKAQRVRNFFHLVIHSTAGIPSIILGMFGYTFLVYYLQLGRSLLSGGITLGIMIFPFIQVRVERVFSEIDKNIIHSSYALGVSKYYTLLKLILPICMKDIISSVVLAGGFAMGAAAPIIMTAAVVNAPVPKNLLTPVMALPYHLYLLIGEGISVENAYGTAFVLVLMLLAINILSISISTNRKGE